MGVGVRGRVRVRVRARRDLRGGAAVAVAVVGVDGVRAAVLRHGEGRAPVRGGRDVRVVHRLACGAAATAAHLVLRGDGLGVRGHGVVGGGDGGGGVAGVAERGVAAVAGGVGVLGGVGGGVVLAASGPLRVGGERDVCARRVLLCAAVRHWRVHESERAARLMARGGGRSRFICTLGEAPGLPRT